MHSASPLPHSIAPTNVGRNAWLVREQQHLERVAAPAEAFVQRRHRRLKHPVDDFLFTYYRFPPAKLTSWIPVWGEVLEVEPTDLESRPYWQAPWFIHADGHLSLDPTQVSDKTRSLAGWIAALCQNVLNRPAHFRCFGLHEWAMVYRQSEEEVRHQGYQLRLSPDELARFVDSQSLCCTHYDAFRFFTPKATPRNSLQPTLDTRLSMEQAGCLHTNMDLYKWSAKLWPWIGSDLVGECFGLALEGRVLDMRASPYDLADMGYSPIPIETPEGRAEYEQRQRDLTQKTRLLRERLGEAASALAANQPSI